MLFTAVCAPCRRRAPRQGWVCVGGGGVSGRLGETIKIVLTWLQLMLVFVSTLLRGDKTLPGSVINREGMMRGRGALGGGVEGWRGGAGGGSRARGRQLRPL